ncbi:MAG TPA: aspartate--tRNA ligase [Actinomycetota bacterium]|nr:aspartate--tRNA ligase [Actinomycetota bacterium]
MSALDGRGPGLSPYRSDMCGLLRAGDAGRSVRLAGWVQARRDHGGVVFLDLRDREGLVQVVVHPEDSPEAHTVVQRVRPEFVLMVTGEVRARPPANVNPNIGTGEVEVAASSIELLAEAAVPPFQIEDRTEAGEDTRLRYRYLDLRRPEMQALLRLRSTVVRAIREHYDAEGFLEVETPLLTKSTPEGARDFLVPSRLEPGAFFALPQSPQLFKQLLMVAGVDRYYQIVKCLRDEDPRADRQPEFTQLDVEMSFADEESVLGVTEGMVAAVFRAAHGVDIPVPLPRIRFEEAMDRYGTDKPDLRFGLAMVDVGAVFAASEVQVFRRALDAGGAARAVCVPGWAATGRGRKDLDALTAVAKANGAGGLAWLVFDAAAEGGVTSPLAKFLSAAVVDSLAAATGATDGDLVLVVADRRAVANRALGAVRLAVADLLGLRPALAPTDPASWQLTWVVDMPLVEWNDTERRWDPVHHPFTAPHPDDEAILESDPGAVRARAYDLVLNGWELGGGSVRIHRPDLQRRVFSLIGIDEERAEQRFGWFVRAFQYGAPPHGGIAFGIDRLVAMLAGKDSIREVIAFPKTSSFTDLLTGAPDAVEEAQLKELGLRVRGVPGVPPASA